MSAPNWIEKHCPQLAGDCDEAAAAGVHAAQHQPACLFCRTPFPDIVPYCAVLVCEECCERYGAAVLEAMERAMLAARQDQHAREQAVIAALSQANTACAIEINRLKAQRAGCEQLNHAQKRLIVRLDFEQSRDREEAGNLRTALATVRAKLRNRIVGEIGALLMLAALWGLWLFS